jgi:hypothetical protein
MNLSKPSSNHKKHTKKTKQKVKKPHKKIKKKKNIKVEEIEMPLFFIMARKKLWLNNREHLKPKCGLLPR